MAIGEFRLGQNALLDVNNTEQQNLDIVNLRQNEIFALHEM
jgi:hypothetical protein